MPDIFSDLGFWPSDVLSRNGLKPWWESIRSYVWALMFGASLFMMYNIGSEVNCVLDCTDSTFYSNLSTCQTPATYMFSGSKYADTLCYANELSFFNKYSGIFAAGLSVLMYISTNTWLLSQTVNSAFLNVKKWNKSLSKVVRPAGGVAKSGVTTEHVRDAFYGIWQEYIDYVRRRAWDEKFKEKADLWKIYLVRNIASMVVSFGSLSFGIFALLYIEEDQFKCEVGEDKLVCSHKIRELTLPYLGLWMSGGILQFVIFTVLVLRIGRRMWRMRNNREDPSRVRAVHHRVSRRHQFLIWFGEHSYELNVLTREIMKLSYDDFLDTLRNSRAKALADNDETMLELINSFPGT